MKAVDGINLKVDKGESVGLVGESGCGKSTVAYSILRLLPSAAQIVGGSILFKEIDLLKISEEEMRNIRGKEVSMIFQDPMSYLNPIMKIEDQIGEAILKETPSKKDRKDKVEEALRRVGMPSPSDIGQCYPLQLSGGMQQRALIALALISTPSLLIADEPTTALDMSIQAQILILLKKITDELDMSLLLITHDLGIISELCDKVYVMYAGKIVESADCYTLFDEPMHPYTIGLLSSALSIDEFKEELVTIGGSVPDLTNPPSGCTFHPRCKYVKDICRKEKPIAHDLSNDHIVYCWLFNEE